MKRSRLQNFVWWMLFSMAGLTLILLVLFFLTSDNQQPFIYQFY